MWYLIARCSTDIVIVYELRVQGGMFERNKRRITYCVTFSDGSYGLIDSFGIVDSRCLAFFYPLTVGRCVFKSDQAVSRHIKYVTCSDSLRVREARDIEFKCLYYARTTMQGSQEYVCSMPN